MWGKVANAGQVHMIPKIPHPTGSHLMDSLAMLRIMLWFPRASWISLFKLAKTCKYPRLVWFDELDMIRSSNRLKDFYPDGAESSDSFCRIISPSHFTRIKGLLDRTGGKVAHGGSTNEETKFIEPTIVTGVKGDDSLMRE